MSSCKYFSSSSLKIIAILCMIIDHVAAVGLLSDSTLNTSMRVVGRLAFPIFAFLICEGYYYTKSLKSYFIRLGIFALLSEIAFDLAFYGKFLEITHQNVFFTLFLGLLSIYLFDHKPNFTGIIYFIIIGIISELLNVDYGLYGVLTIFLFFRFRKSFLLICFSIIMLNLLFLISTGYTNFFVQFTSVFSLIFIYYYNNKKGRNLKYIFYTFYPLHLLILYLINKILN